MQPRSFGPYLLGPSFAESGWGEIWKAVPLEGAPTLCLVHVIPGAIARDVGARAIIARNAKQWAAVKDLHVLNLEGAAVDQDAPFLVYEYQQGRLLSEVLARSQEDGVPLSADQCVYIAERLAGALHSVYGARVTHGCLSADRVLVTFEGEVKLLPGVFRDLDTTSIAALEALGPYRRSLPPSRPQGPPSPAALDTYALGALLFELVEREPFQFGPEPFEPEARIALVQSGEGNRDPLPESLLQVLLRSCIPGAPDGYADMASMKADLDHLVTSGEFSPTTFNVAFLMHTLFRGEDEADEAADHELASLDRASFRPKPAIPEPPKVGAAPAAEPVAPSAAAESPTFSVEPEPSRRGLLLGGAIAALALLATAGIYFAFLRPSNAPSDSVAAERLAKLQKKQIEMTAKLKSLEEEKSALAQEVSTAKTSDEKAKAQKALADAQKKIQAQQDEQSRLAASARVSPTPASPAAAPSGASKVGASSSAGTATAPAEPPSAALPDVPEASPSPAAPSAPPPSQNKVQPGDFVEMWGLDTKPKQVSELRVDMPTLARENHVTGKIYVEVDIDETGKVRSARIVKGLNSDFGMNQACEMAARQLKFSPGLKDGIPVRTKMTFPVTVK